MDFAENIVSNPVTIKLRREEESLDNIKQVTNNTKQVSNIVNKILLPHGASISSLIPSLPFPIATDLYDNRCGWIAPPQRQSTGP